MGELCAYPVKFEGAYRMLCFVLSACNRRAGWFLCSDINQGCLMLFKSVKMIVDVNECGKRILNSISEVLTF